MRKLYFLLLLLPLFGCVKDDFDDLKMKLNTSLPLGTLNFDEKRLFELASIDKNSIFVGNDDIITLRDSVKINIMDKNNIKDIIRFDNQGDSFHEDFGSGGNHDITGNRSIYQIDFGAPDSEIEEITFASGVISFGYSRGAEDVVCTIPEITRNGAPLQIKAGDRINLTDGIIVKPVYNAAINSANCLTFNYSGVVKGASSVDLDIVFLDTEIKTAKGYFGHKEVAQTSSNVTINDGTSDFLSESDAFYIANPLLTFNIDNEFDIPSCAIIKSFKINGVNVALKDAFGITRIMLNKGKTRVEIDNSMTVSGSELSEAVGRNIKLIEVEFITIINPTGADLLLPQNIEREPNVFFNENKISSVIGFDMPIDGYFNNIKYKEGFDFKLDLTDYNFNKAQLVITGTNAFPMALSFYLELKMPNGEVVRLNKKPMTMPSSVNNFKPLDPRFKPMIVDASNCQIVDVEGETANKLQKAESLTLKFYGSSLNIDKREFIKVYSGTKLNLELGMGIDAELKVTDNKKAK